MTADTMPELTPEQLAEIERKYDPETAFRPTGRMLGYFIAAVLVAMSAYHFYASGFGLIRELLHRGIHLSFVLGLVFLLFGLRKADYESGVSKAWYCFDGVPLIDIVLAVLVVGAAMYLPLLPPEIVSERVGNPSQFDVFMGSALLILTLEATRRSVGPTLPIIAMLFIVFAYFGPWMPGALKHGGASWLGIINHLYMT
ncbi:MAG: TRAP transporter permease, partial [Amylibacter sp.]|nr:TRAP transporter permease [Amylibacter sp.]